MSNHEFDPEIDPTIREEQEELLRLEHELQLKQEREQELRRYIREEFAAIFEAKQNEEEHDEMFSESEIEQPIEQEPSENQAESAEQTTKKRARRSKKAIESVVTGNVLSNPTTKKYYPYLVSIGVLLLIYLMSSFSVQGMYHKRQVLERELRQARSRSINMSSEAKSVSSRSAVVRQVKSRDINLIESTTPVKVIENR